MNQRANLTMHHSAEKNEDLIMKKKINALINSLIMNQNNSDETLDAVFESTRIHKCFNSKLI